MMIDFQYVLIIVFVLMLIVSYIFSNTETDHKGMSQILMYVSGFGFFFIGLNIIINQLPEVTFFLSESVGIVFWGLGAYLILAPSLNEIAEEE